MPICSYKSCKNIVEDNKYKGCQSCRDKHNERTAKYRQKHPEVYDKMKERMRERRETEEFQEKELKYKTEYCKRKNITLEQLHKEIHSKHLH